MQAGQSDPDTITYGSLLKYGEGILHKAEIPEAGLDAWLLLEYTAQISRAWYFAHAGETADAAVAERYSDMIRKRAAHIPLQHLTHQAFFMGHEFYVDERVLIPRQDTEVVVEKALFCLDAYRKAQGCMADTLMTGQTDLRVLDMCTGSGCILLSILAENRRAFGVGADLSADALAVARQNAGRLSLEERSVFIESDLFSSDFFRKKDGKAAERYDMLVSNPPYIPTGELSELMEEVRLHDPRMALDGREDGLYFYREISRHAPQYLKPGGWIIFEIGYDQGAAVSRILKESGFTEISVDRDLAGLDRVATGRLQTYV